MKKNNLTVAILLGILSILLLFYFFFTRGEESEKVYHWRQTYKANSEHPYGTLFIKELLKSYRPGEPFVYSDKKPLHTLLDSARGKGPADYIFIGQNLYLSDEDRDALLNFIYDGNDAFIASAVLPFELTDTIFQKECDRELFLTSSEQISAVINFYHPTLHRPQGSVYEFRQRDNIPYYQWYHFNPELFCDSVKSIVPLGYIEPDLVNFVRLPFGDGNLYLHTNPVVFTNYYMTKQDKADYAADVFSHLNGKSIIWDEFSRSSFADNSEEQYSSPLSYILQHKALKYAWWMMLGGALLYTFFAAKRKQRAIPVLEEKVNTSLEFVKIVSALHYQNANHLDIAKKKMKYFLYFIRAKYNMHTQQFSDNDIQRLSEKSKVDTNAIKAIFNEYHLIERNPYNSPGVDRLVNLYNSIDHFYKHCK